MKQIIREILNTNTRQLEFWSGLQGIGAGFMAVLDVNFSSVNSIFMISAILFVFQVISSLTYNLRYRHYTNMGGMLLAVMISFVILFHKDGNLLGVGGYLFLGIECGFCAFWTRAKILQLRSI